MGEIDLALRSAAAAPLVLLAGLFLRDLGRSPVGALGAAFCLGIVGHLACPYVVDWTSLWRYPVLAVCFAVPVLFWLFVQALFVDGFGLRPWHAGYLAALVGLGFVDRLMPAEAVPRIDPLITAAPRLLGTAFAVAGLTTIVRGWAGDLVEQRRRLRGPLLLIAGLMILGVLSAELALAGGRPTPVVEIGHVVGILIATLAFGWTMTALSDDLAPRAVAPKPGYTHDPSVAAKLDALLVRDKPYLEPGLTVGRLAEMLGTRQEELRRVINGHLGFRNFNDFVNRYRIDEACRRLADPYLQRRPIANIALDVGFNSLGPFNRAFQRRTGRTPNRYRREHLGEPGS